MYLESKDIYVKANLTLPSKGSLGSLGRETPVIIDQNRPFSDKSFYTCGDAYFLHIEYSQANSSENVCYSQ
jgi:hypothetical protein